MAHIELRTRWIKILKDILGNLNRSMVVILSIGIGVAAVGMTSNGSRIVQRDVYVDFNKGNPALLEIHITPFQEELADAVGAMREVENAEARRTIDASIIVNNSSAEDLELNILPDYYNPKISKFVLEKGSAVPGSRQILLERASARELNVNVGDKVTVEMPDDTQHDLIVCGVVQDVYKVPFLLLREATAYISMDTLAGMGSSPHYNQINLVVAENKDNRDAVMSVGELARNRIIEPAGYTVTEIKVPGLLSRYSLPGKHWANDQIDGMILILNVMSIMAIFLSSGLVINTISAILAQQMKQIGIMRSVGAVRRQLIGMYLGNVLILSMIGLLIAIPLGLLGTRWIANITSGFLNFNIGKIDLPFYILLLQIVIGLLMPLTVALFPIISGTRISVYDALYEYGLSDKDESDWTEKMAARVRLLNPPVMLSIRNTFRNKTRLAFTLITLTLSGAMFIDVFSTHRSLNAQLDEIAQYHGYDAVMPIPEGANIYTVEREALRIPGTKIAEGWGSWLTSIQKANNVESDKYTLIGLPADTRTMFPEMLAGRWFLPGDHGRVVLNDDLLQNEPDIHVGSQIELKVGKKKSTYEVIGITSKHMTGGRIYMPYDEYGELTGRVNRVEMVRVRLDEDKIMEKAQQDALADELQERFENAKISSSKAVTRISIFEDVTNTFDLVLILLVINAGILAVVGGLSLSGTMGLNVFERTREIGVLRAVGASNHSVHQVVVVEGIFIGLISFIFSAFLSFPTGKALAGAVVSIVLSTELNYRYATKALVFWLVLVIIIGMLSSLLPARRASQLTVREVLDYE